jgi:DNA-binding transcriptional LysR family regulator
MVDAWDAALLELRAAAGEEAGELVVGLHTAVGRGLYARAAPALAERHPGVRVSLRAVGWDDPTAGLGDGSSDVALVWLPLPDDVRLATRVLVREPRVLAMPAGNRLADAGRLTMADLLDEPFIALPPEAGPLREFWLGTAGRGGREPVIAAVATGPDETFEMIDAGVGVALVSEGNVDLYRREGVVALPVEGLAPSELAVAWREGERRPAALDMVDCLVEAAVLRDE